MSKATVIGIHIFFIFIFADLAVVSTGAIIKATTAVVIGSVIYKACVAIAIEVGLPATDLKLITAVLFLIILIISMDRKKKVKKA